MKITTHTEIQHLVGRHFIVLRKDIESLEYRTVSHNPIIYTLTKPAYNYYEVEWEDETGKYHCSDSYSLGDLNQVLSEPTNKEDVVWGFLPHEKQMDMLFDLSTTNYLCKSIMERNPFPYYFHWEGWNLNIIRRNYIII